MVWFLRKHWYNGLGVSTSKAKGMGTRPLLVVILMDVVDLTGAFRDDAVAGNKICLGIHRPVVANGQWVVLTNLVSRPPSAASRVLSMEHRLHC